MQKIVLSDTAAMARALALARKGAGRVHPNPMVGALLAGRGRILAEGYHDRFGGPHAEVAALGKIGRVPKDATLFVTMEPCAHYGKTPPCADYLIERGVRRVVVGARDPNPLVSGRGLRKLRRAGVKVSVGLLARQAERLNRDYNHWVRSRQPYVTLKMAQSLDGKIATAAGRSKWISCAASRNFVRSLRREADAIIVGINTVLKDNPRLSAGGRFRRRQPIKVILDSDLRTPPNARLFQNTKPGEVFLAAGKRASQVRCRRLRKKATILRIPFKRPGQLDWLALLSELGKRGIVSALVEGGAEIAATALRAGVVREIYWFIAPIIIGGKDSVSAVGGPGIGKLSEAIKIRRIIYRKVGADLLAHGVL